MTLTFIILLILLAVLDSIDEIVYQDTEHTFNGYVFYPSMMEELFPRKDKSKGIRYQINK